MATKTTKTKTTREKWSRRAHTQVLHGQCNVCGHYGSDCTGSRQTIATRLQLLERKAATLLEDLGELSGAYDSARLGAAMGHVDEAVKELREAHRVRASQERHEAKDDE